MPSRSAILPLCFASAQVLGSPAVAAPPAGHADYARGEQLYMAALRKGGDFGGAVQAPRAATQAGHAGAMVLLGDIPAGGWKQATFSCLVPNQYAGPEALPLKAIITEARGDLGGAFPVALTLNQAGPRVIEQVATAPSRPHRTYGARV